MRAMCMNATKVRANPNDVVVRESDLNTHRDLLSYISQDIIY